MLLPEKQPPSLPSQTTEESTPPVEGTNPAARGNLPNGTTIISFAKHEVILIYPVRWVRLFLLPHTVPSPGRLCAPLLLSPSARDTFLESSKVSTACRLYAPDFHLPAHCTTRSDISPPAAIADVPPIHSECNAKYFGSRPELCTTSLKHFVPCLRLNTLTLRAPLGAALAVPSVSGAGGGVAVGPAARQSPRPYLRVPSPPPLAPPPPPPPPPPPAPAGRC